MTDGARRIEVRATVNQAGLPAGQVALVDPDLPYVAVCLASQVLVPTGREVTVPRLERRGAERPAPIPPPVSAAPAKKRPPPRKRAPRKKP